MRLDELFDNNDDDDQNEELCEAKLAWKRSGNKTVKAYRCTSGKRKGKLVSNPAQCSAPKDIKKSQRFKRMKAKFGQKLTRKALKTKRLNPVSKKVTRMNKKK